MQGGVSWSELQPELINKIYKHITTISEYVIFRSVCKSWRYSVDPHRLPLQQSPWLSFQPSPPSLHFNFFTRPNSRKTDTLPLPFTTIIGSSNGYLVLRLQNILSLFNPISLSQINLPLPNCGSFEKAVLSPPLEEDTTTVVMIFSGCSHLGICQAGLNTQWAYVDEHIYIHDAIFFEDRFYMVDSLRRVFVLDAENASLRSYGSGAPVGSITATARDGDRIRCYLVGCDGCLFLVIRCIGNGRHVDDGVMTKGFAVYKRDMKDEDGGWKSEKSLTNYVVFLGLNQSVMMDVERCAQGFKRNCIYFLDDRAYGCAIDGDVGVFDMSSRKVEALPYQILDHIGKGCHQPFLWFTPVL